MESITEQVISAAKKGDPSAIEELVAKFRKPLFHYACTYLGNEFDAEDVTQDALLKAIRSLASFKGESALGTWLFRIMINTCIDYHRKVSARPVSYLVKAAGDDEEVYTDLRDTQPLPDEAIEQTELKDTIKKALYQLSPEHRTIIVLHDLHGFKYQEIAEIINVSLGTVKSRLFYARQELRSLLEPYINEEG